jgi:hypothetical protein
MKFRCILILLITLCGSDLLAEDKFYFDLMVTYAQKSDQEFATIERYSLKNNRITYEWKYTGQHPNIQLPREIKRTIILKHTKKLEEFLDKNHLISDMNISLFSKRLPQDDYHAEVTFKIFHKNRFNNIFITGLRPIDDEKNREFDLVLEFMEILRKELGINN